MFCKKCGKELPENIKFCGNCGSPVNESNHQNNEYRQANKNNKRKKGNRLGFALLVFACIVILGLALYFRPSDLDRSSESDREGDSSLESGELYEDINDEINAINDNYINSEGYIPESKKDEVLEDVLDYAQNQYDEGTIIHYEQGTDSVYMETSDYLGYVYIPNIKGKDIGANEYSVATMQPCASGYVSPEKEQMAAVDASAEKIEIFTGNILFDSSGGNDDNYDDWEVTLDSLLNIADYRVIIWHGHGTNVPAIGSVMVTGIDYTDDFWLEHNGDFFNKRFVVSSSGHVMVTPEFFNHYIDDGTMDGAIVYLGTCSSGADDRLAQSFINKGAYAVFTNSGTISTTYNLSMIESVFNVMCSADADEVITTYDALTVAKQQNGAYDLAPYETTYVILYENPLYTHAAFGPSDIMYSNDNNQFAGKTYSGYYTYDSGGLPIPFTITFDVHHYNDIGGTIVDDEAGEASFYGSIDNYGDFYFVKDYADSSILYAITYYGTIDLELGLMSGTWHRQDGATGTFSIDID